MKAAGEKADTRLTAFFSTSHTRCWLVNSNGCHDFFLCVRGRYEGQRGGLVETDERVRTHMLRSPPPILEGGRLARCGELGGAAQAGAGYNGTRVRDKRARESLRRPLCVSLQAECGSVKGDEGDEQQTTPPPWTAAPTPSANLPRHFPFLPTTRLDAPPAFPGTPGSPLPGITHSTSPHSVSQSGQSFTLGFLLLSPSCAGCCVGSGKPRP